MNTRNYGIDLLRIIAMCMIVLLHTLGRGGILSSSTAGTTLYNTAWFLEIMCYGAVNVYALISGYVGWKQNFKYSKIAMIWLQLIFYSVLISFYFIKYFPETLECIGWSWKWALMPIMNNQYWYITCYFGMSIFIPLMNKAIVHMEETILRIEVIMSVIFFSIVPFVTKSGVFGIKSGYSILWLMILYLIGGYISKYSITAKIRGLWLVFIFFISCFITWIFTINGYEEWLDYTSITVLISSISLLLLFGKMLICNRFIIKSIVFFTPMTLGVYILHANYMIWTKYMGDYAISFTQYGAGTCLGLCVFSAIAIYIGCSLVDYLRLKLFSLCKINTLLHNMEEKIYKIL